MVFSNIDISALWIALVICSLLTYWGFRSSHDPLFQFPGPPAWPIAGNIPSLYRRNVEKQYAKWAATYGDVFRVKLGVIPVLVINSASAAQKILVGKSSALASRPRLYTFHEIISRKMGPTIGTSSNSAAFNRSRKETALGLGAPTVKTNLPHIDKETSQLVTELLSHGDNGLTAVEPSRLAARMALSLSASMCYGRQMSLEDPLTDEILSVEDEIHFLRSTTGNLQDYIPLFRRWPFNGNSRRARRLQVLRDAYVVRINREADYKLEQGIYESCLYTKNYLSSHPLAQSELSAVLLSFLSGGLATTRNTLLWCFTILAAQPEIQNTAYEAIRQVYPDDKQIFGSEMVETEEVQYIRALLRECLRAYTPVRLSLPRLTTQEFEYEGKTVPPDTMVLLNAWACNMDPLVYEDPKVFRPERWLENPDLPLFAFGLGYRVCPGYHLANRDIYVALTRAIGAFEIKAVHQVDADPLTGCADPTDLVMAPRSHSFYFVPRDLNRLKEVLGGC